MNIAKLFKIAGGGLVLALIVMQLFRPERTNPASDPSASFEAVVKPPKEPKPKAKPRSRAAKVTRMKVVWGVFNNSNQRVAVYEYPKRKEADEHAARLTADKKSTHFVQPVKEPIEEKKEG